MNFLTQQLILSAMIFLFYDENVIGKSSTVTVVAYRLGQEYNQGNTCFLLKSKSIQGTQLSD